MGERHSLTGDQVAGAGHEVEGAQDEVLIVREDEDDVRPRDRRHSRRGAEEGQEEESGEAANGDHDARSFQEEVYHG